MLRGRDDVDYVCEHTIIYIVYALYGECER